MQHEIASVRALPGSPERHLPASVLLLAATSPMLPVVRGQRDLDVVRLAGHHRAHDVVGGAVRTGVRAVEVEVRVVELMRTRKILGH
jgi:hypothetical protein